MQPKVVGPCRAAFFSHFYNSETGACESFIYGGCQGNDNRFPDKETCEKECLGEAASVEEKSEPQVEQNQVPIIDKVVPSDYENYDFTEI